jgi:hypothetical protein
LDLAIYPFSQNKFLFWWQTVPLGRPLVPESPLDAVLLTFPPLAAEKVTFLVDGTRRDLVWVVPICGSELEYCRCNGVEALEELLESKSVDVTNLFRKAVVP